MHTIKQGFAWIEWNGINAAINVYPTNDYFLQSVSDWWKLDIHVSFHYLSIDTLCAFVVLPFFWIYFVRTFCFQWQLCWYWMYWHQMTESVELHSTYPNKNTQSLIFSQFWWVFRNSRFFLNSSCRDILQVLCILCIWMYCYLRATTREVPLNYRTPQHFKKKTRLFSSGWAQIE